ncbi:MAG: penicillin-binding protein 1A [Thalassotalea sp.]
MVSLRKLIKFSLFSMFFGLLCVLSLYLYLRDELPSVQSLQDLKWQTPMQIFSTDGKLISQFGEKKRIPLKLHEMPPQLINALLATEDDRFYMHFGVDPIGMGRAVLGKLMGQNKGGASTITMQVARNFFLTREVTAIRKIREIFLAFHIESLLSKDEILELYMNKIELGHRAFGYGAAAQVYYGKDVKELTLAQIAVLAGLPKAPSTMNPISSPERAMERRAVVLKRMLVSDYISVTEYQEAKNAPITAQKHGAEIELTAPYIAEMAHQEMLTRYSKEDAYSSGYKVFTTVSSKLQSAAKQAVIDNLMAYDQRHGYRGPILQLGPLTKNNHVENAPLSENDLLTAQEISEALNKITTFESLIPAFVESIQGQTANIIFADLSVATIEWQGLSWAREYINDSKQGRPPEQASDILTYGDVIYVERLAEQTYKLSQLPDVSSALVSLSPDNGAIKAAVGGFSFKQSQFNRATQAKRQVGSNIKPFIYSAALDNGFTLASLVNDAPINKWDNSSGVVWRPKNSPPVYDGPIRVRLALAQSKNVIAVRLLRAVGLSKIIDHLSLFGFSPAELPNNESLALGSASLTPMEVATGFATFANGGYLIEPYLIERIEDSFGNIIFQAQPAWACEICDDVIPAVNVSAESSTLTDDLATAADTTKVIKKAKRVISEQNAFLMAQALQSAIWGAEWSVQPNWQGTGFRARSLKRRDIAGKTGTTNEAKDAWFSGFSRRLVATSWIGFDDHSKNLGSSVYNANLGSDQTTGKEFGARSAQPAWIQFMATGLADLPVEPIKQPENILSVRIDKTSGKLTNKTDKTSTFEYFSLGTEPTDYVVEDNSGTILIGEKANTIEELF